MRMGNIPRESAIACHEPFEELPCFEWVESTSHEEEQLLASKRGGLYAKRYGGIAIGGRTDEIGMGTLVISAHWQAIWWDEDTMGSSGIDNGGMGAYEMTLQPKCQRLGRKMSTFLTRVDSSTCGIPSSAQGAVETDRHSSFFFSKFKTPAIRQVVGWVNVKKKLC